MLRSIALATLILVLAAPFAWAVDIEGTIQSVDAGERSLTLDNGTKIWLGDDVAVDAVKEGAQVKVSYDEKDGKPVATSVEMK